LRILEGKLFFDNIVEECYGKKVWTDDGYGYYFDVENECHIIGYNRRNFSNENRSSFVEKLSEIQ